ncbi:hypothetical protein V8E53_014209 [Lactarius tabidus]
MLTGGIYATCDEIIASSQSKKYVQATNYVTDAPENSERCRNAVMRPTTKSDTATDETASQVLGLLKVSNTILTRKASSILSRLHVYPPRSVSTHSYSLYPPTPQPLFVAAISSLSASSSIVNLSATAHPSVPIACLAFRRGGTTHFRGDILGQPETQRGDEEKALGGNDLALLEEENMDWELFRSRSISGDAFPVVEGKDLLTAVTVKDSAPQGLNQALCSSFAHVTQVHLARQLRSLSEFLYINTRPLRVVYPFVTGRPYLLIFNRSANPPPPFVSRSPPVSLRPACAR